MSNSITPPKDLLNRCQVNGFQIASGTCELPHLVEGQGSLLIWVGMSFQKNGVHRLGDQHGFIDDSAFCANRHLGEERFDVVGMEPDTTMRCQIVDTGGSVGTVDAD